MPYIPITARFIDPQIDALAEALRGRTPGVFNYVLSRLAGAFVLERARAAAANERYLDADTGDLTLEEVEAWDAEGPPDRVGYEQRAEVLGTLHAFLREFERRNLDEYEDKQFARGLERPREPWERSAPDVPEYDRLSRS